MAEQKYDLFISYSSEDPIPPIVCEKLEAFGLKCWIAPRNIKPGVPYVRGIMQGIRESRNFAVFASSNSMNSEAVLNEIENAFNFKKNIIPVLIENIELNDDFNFYLRRKHWITAYADASSATKQLAEVLLSQVSVSDSDENLKENITKNNNELSNYQPENIAVEKFKEALKYYNEGPTQDLEKAFQLFSESANFGNITSQYNLGLMYECGEGVKENYNEAVNWYRKAAEQGHAGAQYRLGLMYEYGDVVNQKYTQAVKWYRKGSAQ